MSTTSSISALTSTTSNTTSTTSSTSLDSDSFLQLLAAELKYQDPSEPVSATEYVSQMAQISSLSQLSTINTAVNNAAAYSMIGQEATYSTTNTAGDTVTGTGTVQSVIVSGSNTYVNVGGSIVDLASIIQVGSDSSATSST